MYHYEVEDGKFSVQFDRKKLLGKEGSIFVCDEPADNSSYYVVLIKDNYVGCIGQIEHSFPKNHTEHDSWVKIFEERFNEEENEIDEPKTNFDSNNYGID